MKTAALGYLNLRGDEYTNSRQVRETYTNSLYDIFFLCLINAMICKDLRTNEHNFCVPLTQGMQRFQSDVMLKIRLFEDLKRRYV